MRRSAEIVMPMIAEDVHEIRQKNTTLDFCLIGKFILCTTVQGSLALRMLALELIDALAKGVT